MDAHQAATNESGGDAPPSLLATLLSEDEVAAMIGKKKRWLQQNRHRGRNTIRYVKIGRTVMYEPAEVARYVERQRFASTCDEAAEKSRRQTQAANAAVTR